LRTEPLRQAGLSVADQAIVSATSFLTTILVARHTGPAGLATYSLVLTMVTTALVVQDALVTGPLNVYVARSPERDGGVVIGRALFLALGLASGAAVLAAAVGTAGLAVAPGSLAAAVAWLAALALPPLLLRDFSRRALAARLDMTGALRLDALVAAVQIGLLILLTVTARLTVGAAIGAMTLACGVGVVSWIRRSRACLAVGRREVAAGWREHWRLGRWILAGRSVGHFNSEVLLLWMLVPLSGVHAAGVFSASLALALVSNPLVLGVGTYLGPRLAHTYARDGAAALRRLAALASGFLGVLLFGLVVVLWTTGAWLLRVLYGQAFAGHAALIAVLSAAAATGALGIVAYHALVALERPQRNLLASAAGVVVLVVVAASLIPERAEMGAALALLAGSVAASATRWALLIGLTRARAPGVE